jgi:hypothetical protein
MPRKLRGGVDNGSIISLTSALNGNGWLMPRPGRFTPRKEIGTHCIGLVWSGAENLSPTRIRFPDGLARIRKSVPFDYFITTTTSSNYQQPITQAITLLPSSVFHVLTPYYTSACLTL